MVNFDRNAKELVDLRQRVYERLNNIKNLALIGPGDRLFIDRYLRFLLGHGEVADFPNYNLTFEHRDNARMYVVLTVVQEEDPDRIDPDRFEIIGAHFDQLKVREWVFSPRFGTDYLARSGFFTS